MKIIRAMRVVQARVRGSSMVGETEQREEGRVLYGSVRQKERDKTGELENERTRERKRERA